MRVLASERVITRLGESAFRSGILAQEPLVIQDSSDHVTTA
jgi:hypothetical protein